MDLSEFIGQIGSGFWLIVARGCPIGFVGFRTTAGSVGTSRIDEGLDVRNCEARLAVDIDPLQRTFADCSINLGRAHRQSLGSGLPREQGDGGKLAEEISTLLGDKALKLFQVPGDLVELRD